MPTFTQKQNHPPQAGREHLRHRIGAQWPNAICSYCNKRNHLATQCLKQSLDQRNSQQYPAPHHQPFYPPPGPYFPYFPWICPQSSYPPIPALPPPYLPYLVTYPLPPSSPIALGPSQHLPPQREGNSSAINLEGKEINTRRIFDIGALESQPSTPTATTSTFPPPSNLVKSLELPFTTPIQRLSSPVSNKPVPSSVTSTPTPNPEKAKSSVEASIPVPRQHQQPPVRSRKSVPSQQAPQLENKPLRPTAPENENFRGLDDIPQSKDSSSLSSRLHYQLGLLQAQRTRQTFRKRRHKLR